MTKRTDQTEGVVVSRGQNLDDLFRDANKAIEPTGDTHQSSDYMSAAEAAKMLGVVETTVTRRIAKGELLGFKTFKNTLRIPKDQIKDGVVVLGVSDVIELFEGHHMSAWGFLNDRLFYGSNAPRPIDRLRLINTKQDLEDCLAELAEVKEGSDRGDYF